MELGLCLYYMCINDLREKAKKHFIREDKYLRENVFIPIARNNN